MAETVIGNYRIISELGQGACGRVYLAQHIVLEKRTVALKLMHNVPLHEHEEKKLFLQESRMLEVLHHPYILPIIDAGISEGLPYIVTEYAPHGSLRQLLQSHLNQQIAQEKALIILAQIGVALQYAHEQQVVHRDLKPENILFNTHGDALLADFGLAITLASMSMHITTEAGTPAYMAPEQFQGMVSREGDQYALGCIAYELFTGQHLFNTPNVAAMMFSHLYTSPVPPSQYNPRIAPRIEQAILKALAKERHDRYPDVAAFLVALGVPSPITEGVPVNTYTLSATNERLQILSQAPTIPPFVGTSRETRLSTTELLSVLHTTVLSEKDKDGKQEPQLTQPLLDKTLLQRPNQTLGFRRSWFFVALVCVVVLAAIVTPFIFAFPKVDTKSTLAAVPLSTPQTTPGLQPTQQQGTVVVYGTQNPHQTATSSPQATTIVSATPTDTATATPTDTATAIPTKGPTGPNLTAIPSKYNANNDCTWQSEIYGQHANGTWTCATTLQNSTGTQKTLNWSASSSGINSSNTTITFSQTSGILAPEQAATIHFYVYFANTSCSRDISQNATVIFAGTQNTIHLPWQCTAPPYTISPLNITTKNCQLSSGQWQCTVNAIMYSKGLVALYTGSSNSSLTTPYLVIMTSPDTMSWQFTISVAATACPGTFAINYEGVNGNTSGSLTC